MKKNNLKNFSKFLFLVFLIYGCKFKTQSNQESSNTDLIISEKSLLKYKSISEQHIDIIHQRGDTLDIGSSGKLIYRPFGVLPYADSLEIKYNRIFSKESITVENSMIRKYLLNFNETQIKVVQFDRDFFSKEANNLAEYNHQIPLLARVIEAEIYTDEIILNDGVKVGMSKEDFFKYFLGTYDQNLSKINVVINEDTLGELITQYFKFDNNSLKEIIFKGNDYWK